MKWLLLLFRFGGRAKESVAEIQVKGWYRSKTVWVNLLTLGADVLVYFYGPDYGLGGDDIQALSVGAVALANLGLRFVTKTPIGAKHEVALAAVPAVDEPPTTGATPRPQGLKPYDIQPPADPERTGREDLERFDR